MNIASVSPGTIHNEKHELSSQKSSFVGRIFNPNWEKILFVCNTALLVAGVFHFYVLNLPLAAISLGSYAISMLMLRNRYIVPKQKTFQALRDGLHVAREHNTLLEEKINRNLSREELRDELQEDIRTAEEKFRTVRRNVDRYKREAAEAKGERDLYRQQARQAK